MIAAPLTATAVLWFVIGAWPKPRGGGQYDFTGAFVALACLLVGVTGTLLIWLVYFAWLALK